MDAMDMERPPPAPAAPPGLVWGKDRLTGGQPQSAGTAMHEAWLRATVYAQLWALGLPLPRFDLPVLVGADVPLAQALVNHGRWLAQCPWCAGAEYVWSEDDWFYCCSCGNTPVGGQRLGLHFAQLPAAIEAELCQRADVASRNWRAGETVEDLQRELAVHGAAAARSAERGPMVALDADAVQSVGAEEAP